MPELPEVQTIVDDLNSVGLVGCPIRSVQVYWPRSIAQPEADLFCRMVRGRTIEAINRRAKYIRFYLDRGLCMAVHLRMTGKFILNNKPTKRDKHEHVILKIGKKTILKFHDTRKFGRFYLMAVDDSFFDRLGPEPLDYRLTSEKFAAMLKGRSRSIKPLLLDQSFIAGLGNIYVDEALWSAGIHPMIKADRLGHDQGYRLLRAIRKVLRSGLKNAGTTLGQGKNNYTSLRQGRGNNQSNLKVFQRTGLACPKCGRKIEKTIIGQRSTHFCPRCQPSE
jgi:formamidopyrimidine-DNA glycosylase